MFPKFLRKNKLKKENFLKTRFRRKISSEFKKAKIKAEPQGPRLESEKTPIETINEKIAQEHPQIAKTHQQEIDSDLEDAQQLSHHVSEKSIGYFWDGIIVLLRIKWKYIERLTDDERAVLGQMWRPFFTKYTSEKFLLLGIPAICTIGLVGKHILDSKSSEDTFQCQ